MGQKSLKVNADYNKGIINKNIGETCTEYMKIFGANNNLMRHLPQVYDGLKPGERRILYAMYINGYNYDKPFKKVASITGKVLDFHPHGDMSINQTIVKLAQPWNNIQCLVQGNGNFGTVGGAEAGAPRYIEARLSKYAYKCFFEDFSPDIVDMKLNYSGDQYEPEFLPARYPNVMINNSFGIGYGMMSSICTYNLKEVLDTTIELIKDPSYEFVLVPDSPTGASIIDNGQFKKITKTGEGTFKMRGVIDIDEDNNCIIIRSTPLQAFWDSSIKKSVFELLNTGKSNMMSRFSDDTEDDNMCYRIYLKKEVDPYVVRKLIYKKTAMEKTFSASFKLVEDYIDKDYNIKSILLTWIDFRRETKRRYFNHMLTKATERSHILQILLFIFNKDNAEKTISIMKNSENKKDIVKKLMKEYNISSLQADTISELKGHQYSKEAQKRYVEEKKEVDKKVEEMNKIVRSSSKIDKIIIKELEEGIKLFGEERRSAIINIDNESIIADTKHIIVFTANGFVKKLPIDIDSVGFIGQRDYPIEVIECKNTDDLLIFDENGKISKLPVHKLHGTVLSSEGEKLSNHVNINGKIIGIKARPKEDVLESLKEPLYILMVTKYGIVKKTSIKSFMNIKTELIGINLKDDDMLVSVRMLLGDSDILIYTNKGYGVRFNSSEINETNRVTIGVKGINISDDEYVIGSNIINKKDKYLFTLTTKGMCKKSLLSNFKTMSRNDKPLRIITLNNDEDVLLIKTVRGDEKFKVYMKNSIETLNVFDVSELPRLSKGKKMIKVPKGDVIIDIKESK